MKLCDRNREELRGARRSIDTTLQQYFENTALSRIPHLTVKSSDNSEPKL